MIFATTKTARRSGWSASLSLLQSCTWIILSMSWLLAAFNLARFVSDEDHTRRLRHYDDDDDYLGGVGGNDYDEDSIRPSFRPTPQNITVSPGDKAVFRCRVENLGPKTVTWRRLNSIHPMTIGMFTFVSDTRVYVEHTQTQLGGVDDRIGGVNNVGGDRGVGIQRGVYDEEHEENEGEPLKVDDWDLVIKDVRPSDEGVYQCQINTKEDQFNFYNIYLNVKIIHVHGTEHVERGSQIHLVCNATGRPDPPHNVEWYKEGRMIESDAQSGIIITKKIETKMMMSVLAIRRSKSADAGEYFCRSSDQDYGKIYVHVVNGLVEKRGTLAEKITSRSEQTFSTRSNSLLTLLCCCFAMRLIGHSLDDSS